MSVFDGLADIFADTFGEAVIYNGAPAPITAIWWETPLTVAIGEVAVDARQTHLSVRASDIANPVEGDTARRVKDNKLMKVVPPIQPDGKGMIVCNLAE